MTHLAKIEGRASILAWLAALGGAVLAIGLFVAPERIWPAWLVSVQILMGLALAGPLFAAMVRVCSGTWAEPLHPIARSMGSALPLAIVLSTFIVFGASSLYEWTHLDARNASPHVAHKLDWLDLGSFIARTAICLGFWQVGTSWMQKKAGRGRPALWLLLFAISFSVYSFDWLMSLEAEWFSTMFAIYQFSGVLLAGIAALVLLALHQERAGRMHLTRGVRHDLGKLLFAFSFFWGYIWFCQYMLIWYTNMPEETSWFASRLDGSWATMTLLGLAANFLVPFIVLLPAPAKRSRTTLARVAVLLLVGRWLDLYVVVTPSALRPSPPLGVWEVAPPLAVVAVFFLWTRRRLAVAGRTVPETSERGSCEQSALHGAS